MLVQDERFETFRDVCREISERYYFEFEKVGSDGDHVHIFVGAAPRYSPSRVMQIVKSITAIKLFEKYPEIKNKLWGGEFWSDGGYIGTVGDGVTADIIRRYIEEQGTPEEKEMYKQMTILDF
jgi:putative transposase